MRLAGKAGTSHRSSIGCRHRRSGAFLRSQHLRNSGSPSLSCSPAEISDATVGATPFWHYC
jgi:hypothetical protein